MWFKALKWQYTLKPFTHPRVGPNLCECVLNTKQAILKKCFGAHSSSEYLPLCSAQQTHSFRFGGWVSDFRVYCLFKLVKAGALCNMWCTCRNCMRLELHRRPLLWVGVHGGGAWGSGPEPVHCPERIGTPALTWCLHPEHEPVCPPTVREQHAD